MSDPVDAAYAAMRAAKAALDASAQTDFSGMPPEQRRGRIDLQNALTKQYEDAERAYLQACESESAK